MKNRLLKSSLGFLFSNVIYLSIPFLMMPYLTRELSVEDYGNIGIFQTICVLAVSVFSLSAPSYTLRAHFDKNKRDISIINSYFTSILFFCFGFPLVYILIVCLTDIDTDIILLALLVSVPTNIINVYLAKKQAEKDIKNYAYIQVGLSLANMSFSFIFVMFLYENYLGRVSGIALAYTIFSLVVVFIFLRNGHLDFRGINKSQLFDNFDFGIRLLPHAIGAFMISYYDRIYITNKFETNEFGLYFLAVQLSSILGVLLDSFHKANVSYSYNLLANDRKEDWIKHRNKLFFILFVLSIMIFVFNNTILDFVVVLFVGEKFSGAVEFLKILLYIQIIRGCYLSVTVALGFYRRNLTQSVITLASGILSVVLMFLFSDIYGIVGVVYASLASITSLFILTFIFQNRIIKRNV
ncbi:oligosaccharide flippase family protein [Vibrio splendidus]|uniref:oligosaccharide flippase family protein n=1 Tax=Vibrio splendidus TaxID=29497 RepID=UPI000D3A2002|nr:oligosaccharide flippase family protein [Vibrio splendidus]PTO85999.1 hypothetical protein CWO29_19590 [Vibrio splendidus]